MRARIPFSPSQPRAARCLPLWLLLVGARVALLVAASPYPRDALHDAGYSFVMPRNCASYCGADNQLCCGSDEACTTLAGNIATCLRGSYAGGYVVTTWTETRTYTSTIMTHWIPAPSPTPGVDCKPQSPEQQPCGPICCAGWQTCAYSGQCAARPGYVEPSAVVITSNGVVTTRYSAPYRVTGVVTVVNSGVPSTPPANTAAPAATTTTSASPTSTSDGDTIGADGSNRGGTGGGLSPGAIAGIVIGTLAGVALLMLLCFCCIARGLWGLIFGGNGTKKRETEKIIVEEESYSRHGSRAPSAYSRRDRHSGWFGGRRPAPAGARRDKKSDGKWWLALTGGATALLALLNFKKDKKPVRKAAPSSRYSDSYYTYSDATDYTISLIPDRRTQRRTAPHRTPG
ncbi:hypothetical protein UVI_02048440 [Ustilaginoidea virens]|uniref:Glycophorin A domain-containing protein n=1 Tax=Ustilaginoidea virens TaxID=1159556 RepID=A0A1B5KYH9_USTVR|nr:hypothetical protein UVI_02048440 [Ustilaginoidea virens]